MPKTKAKVSVKSKSSKGLVAKGKLKFDKTLMAVIAVVVVATGGYLFYQSSHAASLSGWEGLMRADGCSYNSSGIPPTIQYGSTSGCVKFLAFLIDTDKQRYGGTYLKAGTSGKFDSELKLYVLDFQQEHSLAADGVVGPATWLHLDACINDHSSSPNNIWTCKKL